MTKTDAERILAQRLKDVGRRTGTAAFGEVSRTEDSVHAVERKVTEGRQRRVGGVHSPEST